MELKTSIEELKQSLLESEAFVRYQKVQSGKYTIIRKKEYRLHEFRRKKLFSAEQQREQFGSVLQRKTGWNREYADVYKDPLLGKYLARKWQFAALSSK